MKLVFFTIVTFLLLMNVAQSIEGQPISWDTSRVFTINATETQFPYDLHGYYRPEYDKWYIYWYLKAGIMDENLENVVEGFKGWYTTGPYGGACSQTSCESFWTQTFNETRCVVRGCGGNFLGRYSFSWTSLGNMQPGGERPAFSIDYVEKGNDDSSFWKQAGSNTLLYCLPGQGAGSVYCSVTNYTGTISFPAIHSDHRDEVWFQDSSGRNFMFYKSQAGGNWQIYVGYYGTDHTFDNDYTSISGDPTHEYGYDPFDSTHEKPSVVQRENEILVSYSMNDTNRTVVIDHYIIQPDGDLHRTLREYVTPPNVGYGNYTVNPSLFFDGSNMWLFYGVWNETTNGLGIYALREQCFCANWTSVGCEGANMRYEMYCFAESETCCPTGTYYDETEKVCVNYTYDPSCLYFRGEIVDVDYPSSVGLNDTATISMRVKNTGTNTNTFRLGLSIGDSDTGIWCNDECYIAGGWVDPSTNITWFGSVTLNPGESETRSVTFKFRDDYFEQGRYYDVIAKVYNDTTVILDQELDEDVIFISVISPPSPSVRAEIVGYDFSEREPLMDETIEVKIWIKNTGNISYTFPVGLSIGNETAGTFCNRDCYADGKGDYVYTGTIGPDDTVMVSRLFRFNPAVYDWQTNETYDVKIGVYHQEYVPFNEALDSVSLSDYIRISTIEEKLFAHSISATASPTTTGKKGEVSIKSYVFNNGTVSWNFTLGMSIGLWNAVDERIYYSTQPTLIPPCNVECYVDELGDWVHIWIPPNYTAPFERRFVVPEYFIENQSFDVAVGVYDYPPEEGGHLVTIVYYKNISFVSTTPPIEVVASDYLRQVIDMGITILAGGFRTTPTIAKLMIWGFLTIAISGYVTYYGAKEGVSMPAWQLGLASAFLLILIGGVLGWLPAWLAIIFIVMTALLVANLIKGWITGG